MKFQYTYWSETNLASRLKLFLFPEIRPCVSLKSMFPFHVLFVLEIKAWHTKIFDWYNMQSRATDMFPPPVQISCGLRKSLLTHGRALFLLATINNSVRHSWAEKVCKSQVMYSIVLWIKGILFHPFTWKWVWVVMRSLKLMIAVANSFTSFCFRCWCSVSCSD